MTAKLSRRDEGALPILKLVLIGEDDFSLLILLLGIYCTLSAIVASDSFASASLNNLLLSF